MNVAALPYAYGGPALRGVIRATPEDFFVDEDLGFALDGAGEHVFVRVEKRGANTDWVARELAKFAGLRPDAVSYSGIKDRHAVTRQTFSLHLPGKADPRWEECRSDEFRIIDVARHGRKLKRGAHKRNRFKIIIRDVQGDLARANGIFSSIAAHGVPNYFGEQRFGRDSAKVDRALAMFAGKRVQRHERSLLLSAARSHIFNSILAERVANGRWNAPLDGDVWMLDGTHSIFGPEPISAELSDRCARGDISPTGALWGAGTLRGEGAVAEIEQRAADENAALASGLVAAGLNQERRSLVLRMAECVLEWPEPNVLSLSFNLSSGSYATVVIREICEV
ncbi:MAG: tRNA pseudouridine(13) synthase TruD [Rudaea sp.]